MEKRTADLHDGFVDALIDFQDGKPLLLRDSQVKGLQLRLGRHRHQWHFYSERSDHGIRKYTCAPLGYFDRGGFLTFIGGGRSSAPAQPEGRNDPPYVYSGPHPTLRRSPDHVGVEAARDKARVWQADAIKGTLPPSKREGVKFVDAFAEYLDYLERKADGKGKAARWAKNVKQLGAQLLLPQWGNWTLAEMSERPDAVADWHKALYLRRDNPKNKTGATSANHAIRVIRALYRRRAKRDLRLSKVNLPTAAVEMHVEKGEQKGMAASDFPAWFKTWNAIESPVRRSFHLVNLLTGARPGELSRCRWADYDPKAGTLTIGDAKAGNDIVLPVTQAIHDALRLVGKPGAPDALIFPGCAQAGHREPGLLAAGHALRRTFKTIAQNECKVIEEVSAYLLGHQPEGMSQKYLLKWAMRNGTAIREGQAKISGEMVRLLHKRCRRKSGVKC